jgi:hypothetical protein
MVFLDLERGLHIPDGVSLDTASSYHTARESQIQEVSRAPPAASLDERQAHGQTGSAAASVSENASITFVPPPLFVAMTGYRLTCTAVLLGLGILKAVSAVHGRPASNTLDWVIGVLVTAVYAGFY